jgi:hypothetical protein
MTLSEIKRELHEWIAQHGGPVQYFHVHVGFDSYKCVICHYELRFHLLEYINKQWEHVYINSIGAPHSIAEIQEYADEAVLKLLINTERWPLTEWALAPPIPQLTTIKEPQ